MGYDLHIVRTRDWTEAGDDPISRDEWFTFVDSEPSLRIDPDSWDGSDSDRGHAVLWEDARGAQLVFWYNDRGDITARPRDLIETIAMVAVARKLNANVIGDDGEEYGADGRPRTEL